MIFLCAFSFFSFVFGFLFNYFFHLIEEEDMRRMGYVNVMDGEAENAWWHSMCRKRLMMLVGGVNL